MLYRYIQRFIFPFYFPEFSILTVLSGCCLYFLHHNNLCGRPQCVIVTQHRKLYTSMRYRQRLQRYSRWHCRLCHCITFPFWQLSSVTYINYTYILQHPYKNAGTDISELFLGAIYYQRVQLSFKSWIKLRNWNIIVRIVHTTYIRDSDRGY